MYSFVYDESETWAVWPNHLSLSEFTTSRSTCTIHQIFRYFFKGVRDKLADVKASIIREKMMLKDDMHELQMALGSYRTRVEVGGNFVR